MNDLFNCTTIIRITRNCKEFTNCLLLVVGALKASVIQTTISNRPRCSRFGGGALGAQMNLFDRFARVIKVRCRRLFPSDHCKLLYVAGGFYYS